MTTDAVANGNPIANLGFATRFDTARTLTNERTYETDDYQDSGSKSSVPDAAEAVDNEVPVASMVDLVRTRVVLAQLAGDQERLAAGLAASGLGDFADRADWLIEHRTADEQLAWRMRWAELGVLDPEPRLEQFARPASLAVERRRRRRRRIDGLLTSLEQMEIALRVYDGLSDEDKAAWKRARRSHRIAADEEAQIERRSA